MSTSDSYRRFLKILYDESTAHERTLSQKGKAILGNATSIDIDNSNSTVINRLVVHRTWLTKSPKATDVIGIYWPENWDALSPLELRALSSLPILLSQFHHLTCHQINPSILYILPLFDFPRFDLSSSPFLSEIFDQRLPRLVKVFSKNCWYSIKSG